MGYIPPDWTVTTTHADGGTLNAHFGDIHNVAPRDTAVVVELAFATDRKVTPAGVAHAVTGTVGGVTLPAMHVRVSADAAAAAATAATIGVSTAEYGWQDELFRGGQGAFDMVVDVPAGAGEDDLTFEALPDFDHHNASIRMCRVRAMNIGRGLPCLRHAYQRGSEVYSKTHAHKAFDNFGELHLGQTCPIDHPVGVMEEDTENRFTIQVVYELPPQAHYKDYGEKQFEILFNYFQ